MSEQLRDLANHKLVQTSRICSGHNEMVGQALQEMGPSDFVSDLTDTELTAFIKVMDWIEIHVQYARGQDESFGKRE